MNLYALIMAGGAGTRLWPRSRTNHPKQFLDLTGKWTMLQEAQARLEPLIPVDYTFIATNHDYVDLVSRQLPAIPGKNIIGEPSPRGTAAAIGLAAVRLHHIDPAATMAVLTADHLIARTDVFRQVLSSAARVAREGWLVTLGIKPDKPETGYGYIQLGEALQQSNGFPVHRVLGFVEKPDLATALQYLESGKYFWNSGMFIWTVERILQEFAVSMPDLYSGLLEIENSLGKANEAEVMDSTWGKLPRQTIDYGIMEKAKQVAVLPVDIGWSDVGSWSAVYEVLPQDKNQNAVVGKLLSVDTQGSLFFSPRRLVAAIGLQDMVVVDTDDVLLICPRERSQEVKGLVELLKSRGEEEYLKGAKQPHPLLTSAQARHIFSSAPPAQAALFSLVLHAGIVPSLISGIQIEQLDLHHGWVTLAEEQRPLPEITVAALNRWISSLPQDTPLLFPSWQTGDTVLQALQELGELEQIPFSTELLHETLAKILFENSPEGVMIRSFLRPEESALLRISLNMLFPFNVRSFGDNTGDLALRAHSVLNHAVDILFGT